MTVPHRRPSPRFREALFGPSYRRGRHSGTEWCTHPARSWGDIEDVVGSFYAFESFPRNELRPGVLAAWMIDGSAPELRLVWNVANSPEAPDDSFLRGFCEAVTAYFDGVE